MSHKPLETTGNNYGNGSKLSRKALSTDDERGARRERAAERLLSSLGRASEAHDHPPLKHNRDAIAVVGMSVRFPGAPDVSAFWRLLVDAGDAVREVPSERWDVTAHDDARLATPGGIVTKRGGFIDDIDQFDSEYFGMSDQEAVSTDPQHRLLLEVAREALEDAALPPMSVAGTKTGVYIGISSQDYGLRHFGRSNAYSIIGNSQSGAANRLSYHFGLTGPSISINTACSSSLVAVHLAVRCLREREAEMALAAGVNLMVEPAVTIALGQAKMLSPEGRCRTFDAAADGYVRGEGCAVLVLKRLADAILDGDPIWATIRGSAVNQDGKSRTFTSPCGWAQVEVVRQALADAGLNPGDLDFVEAHGTGTRLGDPIEVAALAEVFGPDRATPLRVGSVKTNIGHLEAAAGIAGLTKAILSVHHGMIPPTLGLVQPNPLLRLHERRILIPTAIETWPVEREVRTAGVSSFGIGGTNVHVLVQNVAPQSGERSGRHHNVIALSARNADSLRKAATSLSSHLRTHPHLDCGDVCFSQTVGRDHHQYRWAIPVRSTPELAERLGEFGRGESVQGASVGMAAHARKVAFLFGGGQALRPDVARTLYETEPEFSGAIERCAKCFRGHIDQSLFDLLFSDRNSGIAQNSLVQPAIFAVSYALACLWRSWGIEPSAVLGHGLSELTAAVFVKALTLEAGCTLLALRSQLKERLAPDWAMTIVRASRDHALGAVGKEPVTVAAVNSRFEVVLSGTRSAVDRVVQRLAARQLGDCVPFSSASHAADDDLIAHELVCAVNKIEPAEPTVPWVSTFFSSECGNGPDPGYWAWPARIPVCFEEGIKQLAKLGCTSFVELNSSGALIARGRECLPTKEIVWLQSLTSERDCDPLGDAVAAAYTSGLPIDWHSFHRPHAPRKLHLPPVPFDRRRCWLANESSESVETGGRFQTSSDTERERKMEDRQTPPALATSESLISLAHEQARVLQIQARCVEAILRNHVAGTAEPNGLKALTGNRTEAETRSSAHLDETESSIFSIIEGSMTASRPVRSDLTLSELNYDSIATLNLSLEIQKHFPDLTKPAIDQLDGLLTTPGATVREVVSFVRARLFGRATDADSVLPPTNLPERAAIPESVAPASRPASLELAQSCIEDFPEVRDRRQKLAQLGSQNPFFREQEGIPEVRIRIGGRLLLNFSNYDFCGLCGHPTVHEAAKRAIDQYGTSASASRPIAGQRRIHRELEDEIADFLGVEAAVVLIGGHATNETTIGHLLGPQDLIIYDESIHNSVIQGAKLSGAARRQFLHNDCQDLDTILKGSRDHYRRVLIVTEGVFSMDGDIPDLPRLVDLKQRHKALLMVDEAHSLGVLGDTGRGAGEYFQVERSSVDIWMGTLSKALVSCGGYIAGSRALVDYLKYSAPGFLFSVGITPQNTAAALAALRVIKDEPSRVHRVRDRATIFRRLAREQGLDTGLSDGSAIVPIMVRQTERAFRVSHMLFERGINAYPVMYPAVKEGQARLRFFLSANHTDDDIAEAVSVLATVMRQ